MALTDNDKLDARDALTLALTLNEPETMIEGLRRLCAKRLETAHMSEQERERWQAANNALDSVATELENANKPHARDNGAPTGQAAP